MLNGTIIALTIIIVSVVLCYWIRVSGTEMVKRSRRMIRPRDNVGLHSGTRREKAIFANTVQNRAVRNIGNIPYERPLEIAGNRSENVLPPPEPVQGVNTGNEII